MNDSNVRLAPIVSLLEGKPYRGSGYPARTYWPLTPRMSLNPATYAIGLECVDLTPKRREHSWLDLLIRKL